MTTTNNHPLDHLEAMACKYEQQAKDAKLEMERALDLAAGFREALKLTKDVQRKCTNYERSREEEGLNLPQRLLVVIDADHQQEWTFEQVLSAYRSAYPLRSDAKSRVKETLDNLVSQGRLTCDELGYRLPSQD